MLAFRWLRRNANSFSPPPKTFEMTFELPDVVECGRPRVLELVDNSQTKVITGNALGSVRSQCRKAVIQYGNWSDGGVRRSGAAATRSQAAQGESAQDIERGGLQGSAYAPSGKGRTPSEPWEEQQRPTILLPS